MARRTDKHSAFERWPWDPVKLEPREVSALKAIDDVAFKAILKICGYGANPFCGGGDDGRRATDFACGKHFVGGTLSGFRAVKMPGGAPAESGPHARTLGPEPQ